MMKEETNELELVSGDGSTEGFIPDKSDLGGAKKRVRKTDLKTRDPTKRRAKKKVDESPTAVLIKYGALFLLVAQMVGLVLLMRYSRTSQPKDQPLYLASTAVFMMEVMKLGICCCVIAYQSGGQLMSELNVHVLQSPVEMAKLSVPSFLYTVQNNLLYLALTNLDAATYQVCYQLKILTTAVFSMVLLQRKFSPKKWAALILLTIGVSIVQVSGSRDQSKSDSEKQSQFIGLVAVLCAACTSGFSGVYFEKILKGSQTSLWLRNVQMGLPSVIIALLTVFVKDSAAVASQGFFGGYSSIVWTVVTVQAVGGLIVAVVVKYADNVLKVFATSFSIVVSCVLSAIFFDFHASFAFIVGAGLVVLATVLYSQPEKKLRRKPILPTQAK
ncbi:UDP-galactose transporter [Nitzschia inconspicua]|uniref:UDP-galactose transporter n=1 Tax=Nitzschia inconspicua TaxID=303405 RepID=A0A9K3Q1D7_9STRA|nr:UDP-galactose transporter [Nitzschia inconspicua]